LCVCCTYVLKLHADFLGACWVFVVLYVCFMYDVFLLV